MATASAPRRAGSKRQRRTASIAASIELGVAGGVLHEHVADAPVGQDVHAQQGRALDAEAPRAPPDRPGAPGSRPVAGRTG